jgi:hypothetical protein
MRKLMFSLVATLAFGSFAMANNVEVETVEAVSVETLELTEINFQNELFNENQFALTCQEAGQQIYRKYRGTFGHSAAIAMANAAVDACIAAAKK